MDLRKIKKLIELVEESGIAELEVKSGEEAVRIVRPMAETVLGAPVAIPTVAPLSSAAADPASANGATPQSAATATTFDIRAPMAGTFYVASEPGADPFVAVGSEVAVGDVVCIIESMKMMNEIRADQSGVMVELLVSNAEPVASGQVLMRVR